MTQAVLIIAYDNVFHLLEFVKSLTDDFKFYIHLDRKASLKEEEIRELAEHRRVTLVSRKFSVNWGGLNSVRAILHLAAEVCTTGDAEYLHLVSGSDFPLKTGAEIGKSLSLYRGREYLESFRLENSTWDNDGIDRLQYFHFTDQLNVKNRFSFYVYKSLLYAQKKLRIRRKLEDLPPLYGGSAWWTLSTECVRYVLDFVARNPDFLKRFENTLIPDEIVLQTIIMNSHFRERVQGHNHRMIIWENADSTHPKFLDERNYDTLRHSEKLFARKFVYPQSAALLKMIKAALRTVNSSES